MSMLRVLDRSARFAARLLLLWALVALVFWLAVGLFPRFDLPSFEAAAAVTALVAGLNAVLWPLVIRVVLPLTVFSFGLASLALNAGTVALTIDLVDGQAPPFFGALGAAFVLSLASMLIAPALSFDDDARQLRIVRRRARKVPDEHRTDLPGVILFEIDGLAEPVLRRALDGGRVPNLKRWLDTGSHQIVPWECDLSSQTGASQAGLLLGSNEDMPGFRWYEKDVGRMMVSNSRRDAVELERRHSDGGGLLAAGGASRGNMFSGDAPRCSATMSVLTDRKRAGAKEYFAYFADPYGFTRTIALFLWDVLLERRAARHQRRAGEEHIDRGGSYPFARAAITVVMRDLNVATLLGDIVEGVPVVYSTFVGYDEVAHHSGIEQSDALAALKSLDAQLARLEKAVEQAPRPYHLVVLSDHGQTQGRPFRQRHGETLEELVKRATGRQVFAPPAADEGLTALGGALTDARDEDTTASRTLARATEGRLVDGEVVVGDAGDALEQQRSGPSPGDEAVVLASGGLGLISFPQRGHRLSRSEIEELHPNLIQTLAEHPGIGFLMVRDEERGAVVVGGGGTRRLSDDLVEGLDPLDPFGPNAAAHLRRTDGFAHCPDLLVNCSFDPDKNEVAPFEEFMGSHGGLGGWQSDPFACVPSQWTPPKGPVVGVESMHRVLRGWLEETGHRLVPHRAEPAHTGETGLRE